MTTPAVAFRTERSADTNEIVRFANATARRSGSEFVRLERAALVARLACAGGVLFFGHLLPNLGSVFVVTLGVFMLGYSGLIARLWSRATDPEEIEWVGRLTMAADVSLVGFALLVFAPDPGWTVHVAGFLAIAAGGLRFRDGALLAAASLSLSYLLITIFRIEVLAIPVPAVQIVLQLGSYLLGGAALNRFLPEMAAMRTRELEVYEPLLQAQEQGGEALLMTEAGRPVFWNTALRSITGYDDGDLSRFGSVAELIFLDRKAADAADALASGAEPQAAHLFAKDGRRVDVEVSRRMIRADAGEREVWIVRDVTAQHRAESSLRDQALHDVLTGLPNRALLEDRLRVAIVAAQRRNACVSVMLLDLDRFKQVNDVFGHKAGDAVLVEVAKRLRIALRSTDTVARLGGDEFVVVLPDTSLAGADLAAASMLTSVGAPISFESKYVEVGVSIGITMHPGHGDDAETLLRRADLAMYAAKKAGGGSTIFTPWLESAGPATRT